MIESLLSAAGGWVVGKALDASLGVLGNINVADTRYLNHDPKRCNHFYHLEESLGGYLPYQEVFDFSNSLIDGEVSNIKLSIEDEFFTQGNDLTSAVIRAEAYSSYRNDGHAKRDSQIVRVKDISIRDDDVLLTVQPTKYFCQAESNLILDYEAYVSFEKNKNERKKSSLREIMYNEDPGRLPSLSDKRLANSLGVAICLLSREGESTLLRMVNRSGNVGVFPKGIHPAMSCAINWNNNVISNDLMSFIMSDIEEEMLQETGLKQGQYETPVPLSICREYLRGGKPQLFAISYVNLTQKELNSLRDEQVKLNKKSREDKIEMESSGIFSQKNPSLNLANRNNKLQFTHEGAACFFLVDRLLRKVEQNHA